MSVTFCSFWTQSLEILRVQPGSGLYMYYFGTVVFAYFTGTCEGARACTTSMPVPYSPMYLTGTGIRRTGTGIRRTGICRSLTAAPEAFGKGIFLA